MATRLPRTPTRAELAEFLKTQDLIRWAEQLTKEVNTILPDDIAAINQNIEETAYPANAALAAANQAIGAINRLSQAVELLAAGPQAQPFPLSFPIDYIDFNGSPPHADKPKRVVWNNSDDTLNIHHLDNVVQQVGLEYYVRFTNNTGVTIANGTVVGLDYVGGATTDDVVPFIADGTVPMLNIVGIVTQDIPDGTQGRATVFGQVRDIDTTGSPYGETWAQGDVLYASPAVAGDLTNIKPTAPDWCIPIALVLEVNATTGRIFTRITIDQPFYYGEFTKTTDQTPASANTAYAITMDNTEIANGVSIGGTTSQIIVANNGLYSFRANTQFTSTSASVKTLWFWFRLNGSDVANSAVQVTFSGSNEIRSISRNLLFSLTAGDYIELMFACDDTNITLDTRAATGFAPQAPATILIVDQIQQ